MSDNINNTAIKRFNVRIKGSTEENIFNIGANAENVDFSENATHPFQDQPLEDSVPEDLSMKASNIIYGNAYLRNTKRRNIDGIPNIDLEEYQAAFGGIGSDINPNHDNAKAGGFSIAYGVGSVAMGHNSSAIGFDCEAGGWSSHAEGFKTVTGSMSNYAHAEGEQTQALHNAAHAEGSNTKAEGYSSHVSGINTFIQGAFSQGTGVNNQIIASKGIAQSNNNTIYNIENVMDTNAEMVETDFKTRINGQGSVVEGYKNIIYGAFCHAGGVQNTVDGVYGAVVFGENNKVSSNNSLVIGNNCEAKTGSDGSLTIGESNINPGYPGAIFFGRYSAMGAGETNKPVFVIGAGTDENNRGNILTIRQPRQDSLPGVDNRGVLWGSNLDAHFGSITTNTGTGRWVYSAVIYETTYHNTKGIQFLNTNAQSGDNKLEWRIWPYKFVMNLWLDRMTHILYVTLYPFNGTGTGDFSNWRFTNSASQGFWYLPERGCRYLDYVGVSGATSPKDQVHPEIYNLVMGIKDPSSPYNHGKLLKDWEFSTFSQAHTRYPDACCFNIKKFFNGQTGSDVLRINHTGSCINVNYQPIFSFTFYGGYPY